MAKWTVKNEIIYVSFYIMRREAKYDVSLFSHLLIYEPTMISDEWISG